MGEILIIDYGAGNLLSVSMAMQHVGASARVTGDPDEVAAADAVILPGVGAFGQGMAELRSRGLLPAIRQVADRGRPILGICLGMQMLFEKSLELGEHEGLGFLPGEVVPIPKGVPDGGAIRNCNIGWSALLASDEREGFADPLLAGLESGGSYFYFVHSFQARMAALTDCSATINYHGHALTAAVHRENIWGIQFHPEKSGEPGLGILRRFAALLTD